MPERIGAYAGGELGASSGTIREPSEFDSIRLKIGSTNTLLAEAITRLENLSACLVGPEPQAVGEIEKDMEEPRALLSGLFDIASVSDNRANEVLRVIERLERIIR